MTLIVLTGNEKQIFGRRGSENLVDGVELCRFRQMADVAGVEYELGRRGQSIDFVDSGLQCSDHVWIRGLIESHVAVADLDKAKFSLGGMIPIGAIAEAIRLQHPALEDAKGTCTGSCHAFQKSSAVDSVIGVVGRNYIWFVLQRHIAFLLEQIQFILCSRCKTGGTAFYSSEIYCVPAGIKICLAGLLLCACRKGAHWRGHSKSWLCRCSTGFITLPTG